MLSFFFLNYGKFPTFTFKYRLAHSLIVHAHAYFPRPLTRNKLSDITFIHNHETLKPILDNLVMLELMQPYMARSPLVPIEPPDGFIRTRKSGGHEWWHKLAYYPITFQRFVSPLSFAVSNFTTFAVMATSGTCCRTSRVCNSMAKHDCARRGRFGIADQLFGAGLALDCLPR